MLGHKGIDSAYFADQMNIVTAFLLCNCHAVLSFHNSPAYSRAALNIHQSTVSPELAKSSGILKERLFLYNTLSKEKELFKAIDTASDTVSFYR